MSILDPDLKKQAVAILQKIRSAKSIDRKSDLRVFQRLVAEVVAESAGIEGYDVSPDEVFAAGQALIEADLQDTPINPHALRKAAKVLPAMRGHFDEPSDKPLMMLHGREWVCSTQLLQNKRDLVDWTGVFIVGIHRELFREHFPNAAGNMRTTEVIFGGHAGESPDRIDSCLRQLPLQIRDDLKEAHRCATNQEAFVEHVFPTAAQTHADMIRIHPFLDGNGRWARVVTNVYLRDAGIPDGTIFLRKDKKEYFAALNRCMDHGEPGDLARLIVRGFIRQSERRLARMSGVSGDAEGTTDEKTIGATRTTTRPRVPY
ncbi:MAG TPA: Fic family protein [Candidatus Baltobacteraceae bacterium]|nr:Fic family protein [Candidatus Baltobacteraceae bacterium]